MSASDSSSPPDTTKSSSDSIRILFEAKSDSRQKSLVLGRNIRVVAVDARETVREMIRMHNLSDPYSILMGETIVGALLLSSNVKPGERVNLNMRASGFAKQAVVDVNSQGEVRGYLVPQSEDVEGILDRLQEKGRGPWGEGLISVLRSRDTDNGKPYIGTVPLATGHIAKDLTYYYVQSEQISSAVGILVEQEKGVITSASGFLIQILPDATEEEIQMVEGQLARADEITEGMKLRPEPSNIVAEIFPDQIFSITEQMPVKIFCKCSRERVERALTLIGKSELEDLRQESEGAEVTCEFCRVPYHFTDEDVEEMIKKI